LWLAYGFGLHLAFINDDYFFLDKVAGRRFVGLWAPSDLIFNWYRPWSRELHYWVLLHLFGLREPAYHLVNFGLWLAVIGLYFTLVRKLLGQSVAAIATVGLASLALWGSPILWVAGAQELWMLLFSLLTLLAVWRGRSIWAFPAFALALLSKETAAVVPAIAVAMLCLLEPSSLRAALRRTAGLWTLLIAWAFLHPTLHARLFGHLRTSLETERRQSPPLIAIKTLLAQFNLDGALAPEAGWTHVLLRGMAAAVILGAAVWLLSKGRSRAPSRRGVALGLAWAFGSWWILFLPSIGWHAYYGVLGSMGFWIAMGSVLERHRRWAIAAVVLLAFFREAEAATMSWDWGSAWYQVRAGRILDSIRARLFEMHPNLPPNSRLYFAEIPNNIGFLAGDGPAVRVWYEDRSLRAMYLSAYEPRAATAAGGDYFFLFDSLTTLYEMTPGEPEPPGDFRWRRARGLLASLFIHAGNPAGAAREYAALAHSDPADPGHALFAGAAYAASDQPESASVYRRLAVRALGDSTVSDGFPNLVAAARTAADSALWRRLSGRSGINSNPGSSKGREW